MKALDKVRAAAGFLRRAGIENAEHEAGEIIAFCLGVKRADLFRDDPSIAKDVMQCVDSSLLRRAGREPLQYILGQTEFHGLAIQVGPGILIPRPETELLVEEAIALIRKRQPQMTKLRMLDLCTGSGCIALALAHAFPSADVYGTDISDRAIHYAEENAKGNQIPNVKFVKGSLFEPFIEQCGVSYAHLTFDLIISNPPYVKTDDIEHLQPEIKHWEPAAALDGGIDGLDYLRSILREAKTYLSTNGFLMLEIGINQADAVSEIAKDAGYGHTNRRRDYAGIERIIAIWP